MSMIDTSTVNLKNMKGRKMINNLVDCNPLYNIQNCYHHYLENLRLYLCEMNQKADGMCLILRTDPQGDDRKTKCCQ